MVIVKRRPRLKAEYNLTPKHDFAKDRERCAVCGMPRGVWEATHVPCPGEPYAISTNRPAKPTRLLSRLWAIAGWLGWASAAVSANSCQQAAGLNDGGVPVACPSPEHSVNIQNSKLRAFETFAKQKPRTAGRPGLGGAQKQRTPLWFASGVHRLLGIDVKNGASRSWPLSPEFPLVFSHDHPRARSGRNLGNCDAWRQHPTQKVAVY
jgi:hypothetical protein